MKMQMYAFHAPLRCPRHKQQQQLLHTRHQRERPPVQHRPLVATPASPYFTTDTVTQEGFQEDEYESTQQGQRRKAWAAAVRSATGRKHHLVWEPDLDPPLLLGNVTVVLVGPKKPINCGTVARSCSCFEIDDLRIVQPRCQPNTRTSRSVSKGAQWILYRSRLFDSLADALSDVDLSIAMTRWLPDQPRCLPNLPSLLQHPTVQQVVQQPLGSRAQQMNSSMPQQQQPPQQQQCQQQEQEQLGLHQQLSIQDHQQQVEPEQHRLPGRPVRLALVFGREEFGLSDEEVSACDLACAISIGRLQESLSLSHAVTVVLSQLYQARLSALAGDPLAADYRVTQPHELAEGHSSSGTE